MVALTTPICEFGWKAPDFNLPGVDGKSYSLSDIKGNNGSLVQGVQQPYEIFSTLGNDIFYINLNLIAYPNPTTDQLVLSIENFKGKKILIGRARMFEEKTKDLHDPGMFALYKLCQIF